jgi:hypothetical protein
MSVVGTGKRGADEPGLRLVSAVAGAPAGLQHSHHSQRQLFVAALLYRLL